MEVLRTGYVGKPEVEISIMRIVSLLPSATELVAFLGVEDQLRGISHECDYPAELSHLPVLTQSILEHGLSPAEIDRAVQEASLQQQPLYTVDAEALEALRPDLIVTQGVCSVCAVSEDTVRSSLKLLPLELGTRAEVLSLEGVTFEGILRDLLALGRACGQSGRAEEGVSELRARWRKLPGPVEQPPSVMMLEWTEPPWSAGHWVPEQVERAGGREPFGRAGLASTRIQWEQVIEADPDWIVVASCGMNLEENLALGRALKESALGEKLGAVRRGQLWAADANSYFSRPAPRVVDGAELLAQLLGGEAPDPTRALPV